MADQPDMKTLLENVEEYVQDENKIVTYDWLSQSLGIHVNLAKDVLQKYADQACKSSGSSLRIVYSLGGYVGKNLKFLLTSEDKQSKAVFDKLIYSHIYSIQKGGLDDFESLYNVNYEKYKSNVRLCNEFSGISCPNLKQRSAQDFERNFEATKQPTKTIKQESNGWMKKDSEAETKKSENGKTENKEFKKESPDGKGQQKENSKPGEKKASVGKAGISAFFAKQQSKPAEKKKVEEREEEKKQTNKRVVREPSSDEAEEEKATSDVKRFKLSTAAGEEPTPKPSNVSKSTTQSKSSKAKPQANKKKSAGQQKQRKRIQQVSDSESSDGEDSAGEPEQIPSPEVPVAAMVISDDEEIPATPQRTTGDAKRKGRKLVTKHHMDEDGFIVTSKVMEEVSDAEDDDPKESKAPEAKVTEAPKVDPAPKRPLSPAKSKQSSIMKFFARK